MGDRSNKPLTFVALALIAIAAGAGFGMMRRPAQPGAIPDQDPTEVSVTVGRGQTLEVHVAGWVVYPGVVTVGEGSIVADAIDAAGGMRVGARADLINLAAPVTGGEQIVVPGPGEGSEPGAIGATRPGDGLISLNRATAAELEELPGVGPVLAERIVAHRDARGGFERVEDLLEVPGIGEAKLASIRDLVRP
ncbi:MAG TPA: ComEA family DNA-binding protein [Acidimicrobiia bacterium]|jgi:competence protein ComEA|nr:ComEA family DNA-binding protein [Acidimicrobiia bacterium]